MRRVIVAEWMTLNGVVQSPSSPTEDASGGWRHGGWHPPYLDEAGMKWSLTNVLEAGAYLFGRRTYDIFAAYWPTAPQEEQFLAEPFNSRPKYVASRTLAGPLGWNGSTLLRGDVGDAVAALKREEGGDLLVLGSTGLVETLFAHDLVDELRLMIDPVVVGGKAPARRRRRSAGASPGGQPDDPCRRDPHHLRPRALTRTAEPDC
jgi:dihydrofolate reductase